MPRRSSNGDSDLFGVLFVLIWGALYYYAVYPVLRYFWPSGNSDNVYYALTVIVLILATPFIIWGVCFLLYLLAIRFYRLSCSIWATVSTLHLRWTVMPPRIGWTSLRVGGADESTPLLSDAPHTQTDDNWTSKLCWQCLSLVQLSSLLSGSYRLFIPLDKWYYWTPPSRNAHLNDERSSCHLCAVLWPIIYNGAHFPHNNAPRLLVNIRKDSGTSHVTLQLWHKESDVSSNQPKAISPEIVIRQGGFRAALIYAELMIVENLGNETPSVRIPCWSGLATTTELLKTWIANCCREHDVTCRTLDEGYANTYLPPRLLYVGDKSSGVLRVVNTLEEDLSKEARRYLALYYKHTHLDSIASSLSNGRQLEESNLPKTFRHAILLTRQLELHYLWIDELCQLEEDGDLRSLASTIGKVYTNSYCTIFAHASRNRDGGLFHDRSSSLSDFPCHLRFSKAKALTIRASEDTFNMRSFSTEVDESPLSQDCYALAARLLSHRNLHFGSKFLFFECNTHICSEATPQGIPFRKRATAFRRLMRYNPRKPRWEPAAFRTEFNPITGLQADFDALHSHSSGQLNNREGLALHRAWFRLVMKFTRLKFDQSVDRIDAIQGLVQAIQRGNSGAVYLHGLWQRHLLYDLLWFVNTSTTTNPRIKQTPSWSWQAVEGAIDARFVSEESVAHNLKSYPVIVAVPFPVEGPDAGSDNDTCIEIRLKCPVYRVLKCTHVQDCSWALDLESETDIQVATLVPDLLNFDRSKEMFFAELVKVVFYEQSRKRLLAAVWSDGIVLKRRIAPHSSGVNVEYERIGRGWIKWRDPSRACVPNTRRQVVKIR